nr:MAG TPA: hypothetical protein [Caudoviricetes sp.]
MRCRKRARRRTEGRTDTLFNITRARARVIRACNVS